MNTAAELIEDALEWLKANYDDHVCWNEADMERVIWDRLRRRIREIGSPITIRSQYRIYFGKKYFTPDLVLFGEGLVVLAVLEIKYEPAPSRIGIPKTAKITTLKHLIPGLSKGTDIEKIERCVRESKAEMGFCVFIDEDSHHRRKKRQPTLPTGTEWIDWGIKTRDGYTPAVLVTRFPR